MAERQVKVTLSAQVAGYVRAMEEASKVTRETGTAAEKLGMQSQAIRDLGVASMAFGTVAAASVGLAVAKWADFDQAMSAVQAATHESAESMELLKGAALDAGARTVFSAEESANAIEELAKAGVSTADILGGALDGALDLAAAGGLGVADAAGIAATALKTFKLEGTDMAHVADLLAAGAGKAMGDVTDLSAALNQSAMVANATGLSIEETTAGLAAFASQGLLGSDAGTSFKSMLQSLTPTSAKAAETMDQLGISAYDSQGNFIGLAEFAGQLKSSLSDLSVEQQQAALKTIFGSDAIRAATVLYSEGEEGIREWTEAVNDQGYAAETARARLDNLKGDIEALGGALDTALIQTGSAANDALREMIQWLTSAVDVYNDLPAPLQDAALGVGILTAGVGLLGGGMAIALPKFVDFMGHLNTLNITSKTAAQALSGLTGFLTGPWSVAIMGAAAVTAVWLGDRQKMVTNSKELAQTLDSETGAVTENSTAWAAAKLEQEGVLAMAERLGISSKDMTDAWLGNADALETVNDRLSLFIDNADFRMENTDWKGWSNDLATVQGVLENNNEMLEEAKAKHERLKEATDGSGDAAVDAAGKAGTQADALVTLGDAANETSEQVSDLSDQIKNFGSAQFDMESSAVRLQDEYRKLAGILNEGGASLDITTEAGSNTVKALLDVASAANQSAGATMLMTGDQEAANAILDEGRQRIIDMRTALGEDPEVAARWADGLVSSSAEVEAAMQQVNAAVEGIAPEKIVQVDADTASALEGIEGVNVVKIDDKTSYVYGDNADAQAKIDAVVAKTVPGKTTTIDANDDNFWSAWTAIQNAQMAAKVINIVQNVTETFSSLGTPKSANGNLFEFANGGGLDTGIYAGGPPITRFAEPETQWEAFISGKPDARDRNRQIWVETGNRLDAFAGLEARVAEIVANQGMPSTLVVKDVNDRLIGTMQVVADQKIDGFVEQQASEARRSR